MAPTNISVLLLKRATGHFVCWLRYIPTAEIRSRRHDNTTPRDGARIDQSDRHLLGFNVGTDQRVFYVNNAC